MLLLEHLQKNSVFGMHWLKIENIRKNPHPTDGVSSSSSIHARYPPPAPIFG